MTVNQNKCQLSTSTPLKDALRLSRESQLIILTVISYSEPETVLWHFRLQTSLTP